VREKERALADVRQRLGQEKDALLAQERAQAERLAQTELTGVWRHHVYATAVPLPEILSGAFTCMWLGLRVSGGRLIFSPSGAREAAGGVATAAGLCRGGAETVSVLTV